MRCDARQAHPTWSSRKTLTIGHQVVQFLRFLHPLPTLSVEEGT